jgi:hypothetical protein
MQGKLSVIKPSQKVVSFCIVIFTFQNTSKRGKYGAWKEEMMEQAIMAYRN